MRLAVPPVARENPFGPLAMARQALQGLAILGPDEAFAAGIPMEFEVLSVLGYVRDFEVYLEPVR